MADKNDPPVYYRTFRRSARNFSEYASANKTTVDRKLTYSEAQRACQQFNDNRTSAQIKRGTKMEFETM